MRSETPSGRSGSRRLRARARLNDSLDPRVVSGQHGWWQACPELGAPAYDAFSAEGANYNLIIGNAAIDPVGGSVPHRSYACSTTSVSVSVVQPSPPSSSRNSR